MGLFDEEYQPAEKTGAVERDDKSRLFETHKKATRSLGSYVKLILIVAACVAVVAAVVGYVTLPGVGDKVLAPKGLEEKIRMHFLENEKRDSTDLTFYQCDGSYWVRVGVETRPDIPGMPNNMVAKYRAKAVQTSNGNWTIEATPILSEAEDVPCKSLF